MFGYIKGTIKLIESNYVIIENNGIGYVIYVANPYSYELDKDYIDGLSLLGWETLEIQNQKGLLPLVKKVKEKYPNKNIWCYTGFDFEKDVVGKMAKTNEETKELMNYIDVIVDGKFEEEKKDLSLQLRGSSNQRIIDVKQSLKNEKIIQLNYK